MPSDPPAERFATPRRLHPASMVLGIDVGQILQWGIVPLVALLASGGRAVLLLLGILAVWTLASRILDWRRRRYSFDGTELRVESGILGRSLRSLDVHRIQQIEIRRKLLHRLLGLATVRVETAGSATEPEVELRVVSESDAIALRTAVRAAKARTRPVDERTGLPAAGGEQTGERAEGDVDRSAAAPERILTVPASHVVLASVTGARLLVLPAFVAAGLQVMGDAMEEFAEGLAGRLEEVGRVAEPLLAGGLDWRWIVPLAVVFTLAAVAIAAIVGLLRDGGFRIDRIDDDLHVSRGLLSTQESLVPRSRVQLVVIRQNWLRRILGFASVEIRSAGGSTGAGGRVTVPLVPASRVDGLMTSLLPGVPGVPELSRHPRAALRRSVIRRLVRTTVPAVAAGVSFWLMGWLGPATAAALGTLPLLGALLGLLEYRNLAHAMTDAVVASRRGALSVATEVSPLGKVQAASELAGPFQRRLGLGSIRVHVAGPAAGLTILDAGGTTVAELHTRLIARAARPG